MPGVFCVEKTFHRIGNGSSYAGLILYSVMGSGRNCRQTYRCIRKYKSRSGDPGGCRSWRCGFRNGGNRWTEGKEGWRWDPSKAYIKEAVKQSLKRLSVEYIDLYQLHGGTLEDNILETIDAFEELKQEGFIKAYGISSIRPNVIREYVKHASIDSVMMQYSLLDRRPEEEVLPLLAENNISVVTRGPLAKGLLSENWIDKLSEQGYLDYSETELRALLTELKAKFTETRHLQEAAIQYNLAHKGVTSIIAGASSMEQVKENVAAVRAEPLSKSELTFMEQLAKMNKYEAHR
mgnify:CR=1 FL=1